MTVYITVLPTIRNCPWKSGILAHFFQEVRFQERNMRNFSNSWIGGAVLMALCSWPRIGDQFGGSPNCQHWFYENIWAQKQLIFQTPFFKMGVCPVRQYRVYSSLSHNAVPLLYINHNLTTSHRPTTAYWGRCLHLVSPHSIDNVRITCSWLSVLIIRDLSLVCLQLWIPSHFSARTDWQGPPWRS